MRFSRIFLTLLLTLPYFLFGISTAQQSPWPMFRHDYKNTGRTDYTGPETPTLFWAYQTNDGIVSSPSIGYDGTIYVGSGWYFAGASDSGLYAINPDGTLKWKFTAGDGIFSSPYVSQDGTIYFGCIDKSIYAIEDSVTYAKLKWNTNLGNFFILCSPKQAPDGMIYIGTPSFEFHAIEPDNGQVVWSYKAGWCIISSPAIIDDGTIYIGSKDHHLYSFNPVTQDTNWAFPTGVFYDGHLVDATPAVGEDGTIYVGTDEYGAAGQAPVPVDTSFWAINPDGTLKWNLFIGDGVESSPAIGPDGTIYFGSYDSTFYAVADSGSVGIIKWTFPTNGVIDGSPTVDADGIIYFGSRDSTLYALYPNGTLKWSTKLGDGIESSPTIDGNGYLYIGSFDGKLYCFGTGAPDVGAVSIDLPSSVGAGLSVSPAASLRNFRMSSRSFDAVFTIDSSGTTIYSDTMAVTLNGSETKPVSFAPWVVSSMPGIEYHLSVLTVDSDDENAYNNSSFAMTTSNSYVCGDANNDEAVNIGDAVFLINYVFKGGPAPNPIEAADANCDGSANVGDAVYLINYAFKGGEAPCCP